MKCISNQKQKRVIGGAKQPALKKMGYIKRDECLFLGYIKQDEYLFLFRTIKDSFGLFIGSHVTLS